MWLAEYVANVMLIVFDKGRLMFDSVQHAILSSILTIWKRPFQQLCFGTEGRLDGDPPKQSSANLSNIHCTSDSFENAHS